MSGQNPIGTRVKQVWQESGQSQEDFASSVGLSRTGLTNIMSGATDPKASTVQRIAQVSNRDPSWFFEPAPTSSTAPQPAPAAAPAPAPEPQAHAPPDTQALLAQLVAVQVQLAEAVQRIEKGQADIRRVVESMAAQDRGQTSHDARRLA